MRRAQKRSPFNRHPRRFKISKQYRKMLTDRALDSGTSSVNLTMSQGGDNKMANAIAEAAMKKAAELRKSKPATKKEPVKTVAKKRAVSSGRGTTDAENAKVAKMYKEGKSYGEISDAMGWTGKGDWPHSYTHGVINRLRKSGLLGYRRKPETGKKGKK